MIYVECVACFLFGYLFALVSVALAVKYLGPRYLRKKMTGAMIDLTGYKMKTGQDVNAIYSTAPRTK